jgi:hypothetical protein
VGERGCEQQITGVFGKVRLYGAVAWGLGALFMGIFNSFFGWTGNTIFYVGTSLTAVLLSMRVLSVDPPKERKKVIPFPLPSSTAPLSLFLVGCRWSQTDGGAHLNRW